MGEKPPSGDPAQQPAVEILAKIVAATDRLKKVRDAGAQPSDLQEARQERRKAIQEAREFLRRQAPQR